MVGKTALIGGLALLLATALTASPVSAQTPEPELVLGFESPVGLGEDMIISAYLLDPAGDPISGKTVTFYLDTKFMNTAGRMKIGEDTTDENGLAYTRYRPTREGEQIVIVYFAGNGRFGPAEASDPFQVAPNGPTFVEEPPFRMPGANIYTVVMAISTVWGAFLLVIGLFWLISRKGNVESPGSGGGR